MNKNFQGTVKIKSVIKYTDFLFGPNSLIENKEILLIKQEKNGDCICLWSHLGIIKIDSRDIVKINYNKLVKPETYIKSCNNKQIKELLNSYLKLSGDNNERVHLDDRNDRSFK